MIAAVIAVADERAHVGGCAGEIGDDVGDKNFGSLFLAELEGDSADVESIDKREAPGPVGVIHIDGGGQEHARLIVKFVIAARGPAVGAGKVGHAEVDLAAQGQKAAATGGDEDGGSWT